VQLTEDRARLLNPPFCCECRHYLADEQLDEGYCQHPVHHAGKILAPAVSTARHPTWWGREACGPEGRHYEAMK
jgi:hypothetical protein